MTEFYKAAFGIFAVLMAGASAWIGIDLIRAAVQELTEDLKKEEDDGR